MKILIVDDESDIREILKFNLEKAGFEVLEADSAEEVKPLLAQDVSLILLDIMLPGVSGVEFSKMVRAKYGNAIPIVFLTAKTTEEDLLEGFDAGGDDYICKPFSVKEVIARVKAVLKRCGSVSDVAESNCLCFGPLSVAMGSKTVFVDGVEVYFPKKEYEILVLLMAHPNTYFQRSDLIAEVWKDAPYVLDRTIDVHIARIRNRLGVYREMLKNKTGFGYCIELK